MRIPFLIPLTATALLASAALAMDYTPPSTKLDGVASGTYVLDTSHANVIFNIAHMGFSHYFGRFNTMNATLAFDAKDLEKSTLNVTVDVDSIDTNNATLEGELRSSQWFDTTKYPTATFTSTRVERTGETTGKVHGDLTLHGVTRPVVLDVTFNGAGVKPMVNIEALGFSAQTTIRRSDFGIPNGIPMVGDLVTLSIETEFHYQPPKQQ